MANPFVDNVQREEAFKGLGLGDAELPRQPELRTAESTPRSLFMDALTSVGVSPRRAGRTAEGFLGRTERNPFGILDFTPIGTPLAAKYSADAFQRGDIKTGLLEALGAIPFGIGRSARAPLQAGEKMETVMLKGGRYPEYGIIDKSDNTLVTAFGGRVDEYGDFQLEVANAVPNPREVDELLAQGEITPLQANDIIEGPKIHPESGLLDALKMRGIKGIGSSIRSGTATKNVRGAMDAMRAASRTKPLRKLEGDFTGQRVTGSRTEARVSIPKSRKKAKERGIKPARDVTLPKTFKEMLRPISRPLSKMHRKLTAPPRPASWDDVAGTGESKPLVFGLKKGEPPKTDYQEIWDDPFQAALEEGQKILGRNRPTIRETLVARRAARQLSRENREVIPNPETATSREQARRRARRSLQRRYDREMREARAREDVESPVTRESIDDDEIPF
jgi:hypothetical protein